MAINIKIHNFEGPFDLLFHLIEKAEVDIYDIPIAEITNQYLDYIHEMQSLDLEVASEFIVMAATLIQIKSKMLLPKESNPLDEISADEEDPRAELVEKLLEYKKYKQVSQILKENEEKFINVFFKNGEIIDDIDDDEILLNITLEDIVNAFRDALNRANSRGSEEQTIDGQILKEEYTVDNKISFNSLFSANTSKYEIIVTFLALLELIRLKEIRVYQNKTYDEIEILAI